MGAVNVKRLAWALNRGFLRHGAALGIGLLGMAWVLGLLAAMGWSWLRLDRVNDALAAQASKMRAARDIAPLRKEGQSVPLPVISERFVITRRILTALKKASFEPEQIRFKFENAGDAGLTRQIAVFTLKAPWSDVAKALAQLQAADRAIYISKLRLARETPDDELVTAEIQLAVALVDDTIATRSAP